MSSNFNSPLTAVNTNNSAPYLTSDRTELAPLCSTHQDTKGLRIIVIFLSFVTILVSVALFSQLHNGQYQVLPHGAVVSDDKECSDAGVDIMKRGGNAIDAVISTMFCLSVVMPHLVGIGGGGILMVYDQRRQDIVGCLDFQAAVGTNHSSIGVPGFVAGLYEAHQSYGKLPWQTLLSAATEKAESGFIPNRSVVAALPLAAGHAEITQLLLGGRNPALLATLQILAEGGAHELYNGSLTPTLTAVGVSAADLEEYRVLRGGCQQETAGETWRLATAGPGSGGPLLLHLITSLLSTPSPVTGSGLLSVALNLKETMLVSRRYSSGVNVVAVDQDDIYVTAVGGLGSVLGALELTTGGYLMNNLNVFGSQSPHSGDQDHLLSLASPVVITQPGKACGIRLVLGASDVRDIAQLLAELLESPDSTATADISFLQAASNAPRARLTPHQVLLESSHQPQLDSGQLSFLRDLNLTIVNASAPYPSLNFIHKVGDTIIPVADSRGGGHSAEF